MWIVGLVMTIVVDGSDDGDGCCGGDCDSVVVMIINK